MMRLKDERKKRPSYPAKHEDNRVDNELPRTNTDLGIMEKIPFKQLPISPKVINYKGRARQEALVLIQIIRQSKGNDLALIKYNSLIVRLNEPVSA